MITRRGLIATCGAAVLAKGCRSVCGDPVVGKPVRGVVVHVRDLSGEFDWPSLAAASGLNAIATHFSPEDIMPFLAGDAGRRFVDSCAAHGLAVEHEMHAIEWLLPRNLFDRNPELFRLDGQGVRQQMSNGCFTNPLTLEIIAERSVAAARICRSTTGRYYYWLSDFGPTCRCAKCRELAPCEQALLVENAIVRALRREIDPNATLSHLAYERLAGVPVQVSPHDGLFLEFAPVHRWRRDPDRYVREDLNEGGDVLSGLDRLLKVFPASTAQVLEYWLDESLLCNYRKPLVPLQWDPGRTRIDIAAYARRGIRNFTTFAVSLNDDYVSEFGDASTECVADYARILRETVH